MTAVSLHTVGAAYAGTPERPSAFQRLGSTTSAAMLVIGLSAAIGVVASGSPAVATVHLVVTFGTLIAVALLAKTPAPLLAVTIYAGGCDVFWRSTSARGPWEGAKYALIVGFACLLVRFIGRPRNLWPVVCLLVLLVPGMLISIADLGPALARELIASNLAGLVALALGLLVCSNLRLSNTEIRGAYFLALSPAVSIAAVATLASVTTRNLDFGSQSNFAASGGFGPVQVSSVLCFGLLCILILLQRQAPWRTRALALAVGTWLVGQAILTFSRGGVFSLVLAAACIGLVALTQAGQRGRTVVAAVGLVVVGLLILSWAGAFTDGASEARFASTDTTNRTALARADLQLFYEQPILGVGVGEAAYKRDFPVRSAAHTEYSRLLAEHGILGAGVLVILGVFCVRTIRAGTGWWRMAAVGLVVMSLAQMAHSATRIGVIALGFALAGLREERDASADG